jgi:NADPH-dependent 2,4-dienoyl-CoA reductase/sulfur reductase-like enzyme
VGQFLSPYANRRRDAWGGDLEGRLRFPLAVVGAVRRAVGPGVPLLYRLSADEKVPGGLTVEDWRAIAPRLEAAGVDLLDVSAGIYESAIWVAQPMEMPPGVLAPLAREIRRHVGIPVSVAGRINDAACAEGVLADGAADFVTLGRALHADPDWPRKSREGRGHEICPCVGCLTCSDLLGRNQPVLCLANTATGREREHAVRPAARPLRVVVAGGGPAGLEAARVLALRGHRVVLFERAPEPGGQTLLCRQVPGRQDLAGLAVYLAGAAARAGADLRLGVAATAETVLAEAPDAVVLATGARPGIPPIPGIRESPAADAFEVLGRPRGGAGRALVLGGGMLGVAVAHALASRGTEVVLAEGGGELAAELGLRPRWQYVADLRARGNVRILLGTSVEALEGDAARLAGPGGEEVRVVGLDLVVPTWPLVPATELSEALGALADAPPLFEIGDASRPRTAFEATQEGAALGHRL